MRRYTGQTTYILKNEHRLPLSAFESQCDRLPNLLPARSPLQHQILHDLTGTQSVHRLKPSRIYSNRIVLPDLGLPETARIFRTLMHLPIRGYTRQPEA